MGFLSQSPRFLFYIHKHLIKVLDVWFAVETFKIQRPDWIFMFFFVCFESTHNTIKYIINI
jgi:hypothetical protein